MHFRIRTAFPLLGLVSFIGCGDLDTSSESAVIADEEPTQQSAQALSSSTPIINRVIPVRFVQFESATSPALSNATLQTQIDGMNIIFAPAGLSFYISEVINEPSTIFDEVRNDVNFTWPTPLSTAEPLYRRSGDGGPEPRAARSYAEHSEPRRERHELQLRGRATVRI